MRPQPLDFRRRARRPVDAPIVRRSRDVTPPARFQAFLPTAARADFFIECGSAPGRNRTSARGLGNGVPPFGICCKFSGFGVRPGIARQRLRESADHWSRLGALDLDLAKAARSPDQDIPSAENRSPDGSVSPAREHAPPRARRACGCVSARHPCGRGSRHRRRDGLLAGGLADRQGVHGLTGTSRHRAAPGRLVRPPESARRSSTATRPSRYPRRGGRARPRRSLRRRAGTRSLSRRRSPPTW